MARSRFSVTTLPGFATVAVLVFAALYLPIVTLVVYSFNAGRSVMQWGGFSLNWYGVAWANVDVQDAALRSLGLAATAALISTVVATMAALATTRTRRYRGQTFIYAMINQPLMVPEIVTAVALLIFFAAIKIWSAKTVVLGLTVDRLIPGMTYLILAHSAFCVPFAYLPIRARLEGMDLTLETAAADLYASAWQCFRFVTLPLMLPGVMAGAMLAFVISLDDVVITEFVKSAGQDTLPTYMLGQLRRGITPEVNAISTALLALTVALLTAFLFLTRERKS